MNTCVHNLDWSHFRRVLSVVNPNALSVLVHLGYLSYNVETKEARIPNYEVQQEFENTIAGSDWKIIVDTLKQSEYLLKPTLEGNAEVVAETIDRTMQMTLAYCVIMMKTH